MREAVIVSTARTPIGKAYRGAFNNTEAPTLGGHAVKHAVERAGVEGAEVDDVIMGCALAQGSQGGNIARQIALMSGLPVSAACGLAGKMWLYSRPIIISTTSLSVLVPARYVATLRPLRNTVQSSASSVISCIRCEM